MAGGPLLRRHQIEKLLRQH